MAEISPTLSLPYMQASQAQKHVTHNEALRLLDMLVQVSVEAIGGTLPPVLPAEGEAHVTGTGAGGAWAGHDHEIATWSDAAWHFVTPQAGFLVWDKSQAGLRVWTGAAWINPPVDLQNVGGLGVNTGFDATNRLAVSAPATLLSHEGAGHQLKINKAAAAETASLLFQSNWTGHAEMGLSGSTGFSVKVSPDGGSWVTALSIDPASGALSGAAVQASAGDAGAGRVMKVGGFGLGATGDAPLIADLNATATPAGTWRFTAATTNAASLPAALQGGTGAITVARQSATEARMTAWATGAADDSWSRRLAGGAWGPWGRNHAEANTARDGAGQLYSAPHLISRILPSLSENPADAVTNAAALNAALAESAATGKTVRTAGQTVPLGARIVPPEGGGWRWDSASDFLLLATYEDQGGYLRPANPNIHQSDVRIEGFRLASDIDPATGHPYAGNVFFAAFADSELNGVRAENYYGDQAFLIALYNSRMDMPYYYTVDPDAGTGGIRLLGGEDSIVYGAKGRSGDDGLQFVPGNSLAAPLSNLATRNCHYIGGTVETYARAVIAFIDTNVTENIVGCGFTGVRGRLLGSVGSVRSASFGSYNTTGSVIGLKVGDTVLEESARTGGGSVYLLGGVQDSDFDITVIAPDRQVLRISEDNFQSSGALPRRNTVRIRSDQAPRTGTTVMVSIEEGIDNQVTPHVRAPAATSAVYVSGSEGTCLKDGQVTGIQTGELGLSVVSAATALDCVNMKFRGTGTAYSFQQTPAASARMIACDLGGQASTGYTPGVLAYERA
ncbi:DUF2793 domain-containing protein [Mesobacterium pallidum]|uniref:DUF2793 domain-containing protein n=1 Tax=Mesobacterium pallidum TaxID=2872037 RepID=UPI001EE38BFE|nr:DUF2793 domain-containing protein [Mesobacterium pallidum]